MKLPTVEEYVEIIQSFIEISKTEKKSSKLNLPFNSIRIGNVIFLKSTSTERITVIGDLHGDYLTLHNILSKFRSSDLIVFLGDYVDRGPWKDQILTVYTLLKSKLDGMPIVMLRGNHEAPTGLEPAGQDFPYAILEYYGDDAGVLIDLHKRLWDSLPHALVIEGVALLLHGGPPTIKLDSPTNEYLGGVVESKDVLEEILWNDPIEDDVIRKPNPRGAGSLWGRPVTEIALGKINGKLIIRGHQPALKGYSWSHKGRVLTLFSSKIPVYGLDNAGVLSCGVDEISPECRDCIDFV